MASNPFVITGNLRFSFTFDYKGNIYVTETDKNLLALNMTTSEEGTLSYVNTNHAPAQLFYGLRDDPFIRTTRNGKNVASIIISYPLTYFSNLDKYMMIWAHTQVNTHTDIPKYADSAGRSFRSMFQNVQYPTTSKYGSENVINFLSPARLAYVYGLNPDTIVLDKTIASGFPNGRILTDDVVKLTCEAGRLYDTSKIDICAAYVSEGSYLGYMKNEVPFLANFPYLAPPHIGH